MTDFTFSSSRRLGYPHCTLATFFFRVIGGQENFPLICLGIVLQMADSICSWSDRGVEVSGIDDVGFWKPITRVGQLWAGLYQPNSREGEMVS